MWSKNQWGRRKVETEKGLQEKKKKTSNQAHVGNVNCRFPKKRGPEEGGGKRKTKTGASEKLKKQQGGGRRERKGKEVTGSVRHPPVSVVKNRVKKEFLHWKSGRGGD